MNAGRSGSWASEFGICMVTLLMRVHLTLTPAAPGPVQCSSMAPGCTSVCARSRYSSVCVCDLCPAALDLLREKGRRAEGGTLLPATLRALPARRRRQRHRRLRSHRRCYERRRHRHRGGAEAPRGARAGGGSPTLHSPRPGGGPAACFRW